jgi:hypothetical protein
MSIRLVPLAVASLALGAVVFPAQAQVSVQKECGAEYQAAKAAGSLGGQTWQQFLQACRARHGAAPAAAAPAAAAPTPAPAPAPVAAPAAPAPAPAAPAAAAPAAPAKPAAAPAAEAPAGAPTTKTGKPLSPGTQAFIEREKACGAEWRAKKAALLKANPRATWPAYLSECNKRLKAQGR